MAKIELVVDEFRLNDRKINVTISRIFKGRTREAIKKHRATEFYKTVFANINKELLITSVNLDGDAVSVLESIVVDDTNRESANGFDCKNLTDNVLDVLPRIDVSNVTDNSVLSTFLNCDIVPQSTPAMRCSLVNNNRTPNSGADFKCIFCSKGFATKIGLGQHKRKMHFNEYILEHQLNNPVKKQLWDDRELEVMASSEVKLLKEGYKGGINLKLCEFVTGRTHSQIKEMRKTMRYKNIFERIKVESAMMRFFLRNAIMPMIKRLENKLIYMVKICLIFKGRTLTWRT